MMKFEPVDKIPKRKNKDLQGLIQEFVDSQARVARILFAEDEYASTSSCSAALSKAIKISGYPIQVHVCDKIVYLTKEITKKK